MFFFWGILVSVLVLGWHRQYEIDGGSTELVGVVLKGGDIKDLLGVA